MTQKLQKLLADAGIASRREIERMIEAGLITVNRERAHLGQRVTGEEKIAINGKPIRLEARTDVDDTEVIMYHKPEGIVSTRKDEQGRQTVFDDLPRLRTGRWVMVGRLDINTSGVLLFTNSGELANRLMHPSANIEREYAVRIYGEVTSEILKRLVEGVELEDGFSKFTYIRDAGGDGRNHWYHVVLNRGRHREVRRLWESQGVTVSRLIRVRFGAFVLPPRLKKGKFVRFNDEDMKVLNEMLNEKDK